MPEEKPKQKKEKMVSFYDPIVDANREIPESLARKYIAHLEELKKQLK